MKISNENKTLHIEKKTRDKNISLPQNITCYFYTLCTIKHVRVLLFFFFLLAFLRKTSSLSANKIDFMLLKKKIFKKINLFQFAVQSKSSQHSTNTDVYYYKWMTLIVYVHTDGWLQSQ